MSLRLKPSFLIWSFLAFLAFVVVTGILVYQFFLIWIFCEVKRQAEVQGYRLEWTAEDLSFGGSLFAKRLDILLEIDTIDLVPLTGLKGQAQVEKVFLNASYFFNPSQLIVQKLSIDGASGELELTAPSLTKETEVPAAQVATPKSLGDLFQFSLKVPELPLEIEINQVLVSGSNLKFKGFGSEIQIESMDLQAKLFHRQAGTSFTGDAKLNLSEFSWAKAGLLKSSGQAVQMGPSHVTAKWEILGEGSWANRRLRPSEIALNLEVDDFATKIENSHTVVAKKMQGSFKLLKGIPALDWKFIELKSSVRPKQVFSGDLKLQPRKKIANKDWELELAGGLANLVQVSGVFDLADEWTGIPKSFSGRAHVKVAKSFFDLFLPQIPAALKAPIQVDGNFSVKNEEVSRLILKFESKWLQGQMAGKLNPSTQNFDIKGQLSLYLPPGGLKIFGHKLAGQAVLPMNLVYRAREKIFLESKIVFKEFSYATDDFAIEALSGELLTYQSWRVHEGRWTLAPLQVWNPFLQVDPASATALDADQSGLVFSKLRIFDKWMGPLFLSGSLRQNHFTIPNWRLQLPQGEFQGALYFDFQPQQPRVGFLLESRNSDLSQILSSRFLAGRPFQSDPTSFKIAIDWDVNKALMYGSFDWYQMTPGQVHNVLDFMDPQGENVSFNMTRNLLNQAYPTRVQGDMKGSLAHFFVETNLVKIPPIRDVPLKAYLLKMKEIISPILNQTLIKEN